MVAEWVWGWGRQPGERLVRLGSVIRCASALPSPPKSKNHNCRLQPYQVRLFVGRDQLSPHLLSSHLLGHHIRFQSPAFARPRSPYSRVNVRSACCKNYNAIAGGATLQGVKEWELDALGSSDCISKKISLGVEGNFGANSINAFLAHRCEVRAKRHLCPGKCQA